MTQEQWQVIMGSNPSEKKGVKWPVGNLSWNDCQDFIQKLNAKTKGGYRLPTEAEWEYACRAGTTTAYAFGDSITLGDANFGPGGKSVTVGSYKPNGFGLYDMHWYVWEWCEDFKTGTNHILRGGSFGFKESTARSSHQGNYIPTYQDIFGGFRLVRIS